MSKGKVVKLSKRKKDQAAKEILEHIDRFPYLKKTRESISKIKEYIDLLEKRKVFALEDYANLTPKEKNDADILIIETDQKIAKSHHRIDERTQYFNDYHAKLVETYHEVVENFDSTRKEAIMKSKDKDFHNAEALKNELDEANNFASQFNTNWELKFRHYLELKKLLTASPAADQDKLQDIKPEVVQS